MADKSDPRAQLLLEAHPDYESFTAESFPKLSDSALRLIMGAFAFKLEPQKLIPRTFDTDYGQNAASEFALAIQRDAKRRGIPEIYAFSVLNGGIGGKALAADPTRRSIDVDVPASITFTDGSTRHSTAPKILNYEVAHLAREAMEKADAGRRNGTYKPQLSFEFTIPQGAVQAIVKANKLPSQMAENGYAFDAYDEMAFFSGYASRAGASKDIGPLTMTFPDSVICTALDKAHDILNPLKPDIDTGFAWATGYIVSDVDERPAAQRNAIKLDCALKKSLVR